ncbi:MAG TPA: endonuclease/exonuclease/phosphatase family protein [Stackebrandtia sp.]|uniref:endonuclease/exonuclease/phosphatase family protein n=1 Tax=Stackebrandtia sp. TaxID=2023065 RepID=UPI002D747EE5|nr:endonuclease/exonuclease/phosphatase family protein [Stackebrandtia sp.]HZE40373.1 endonuclease/exonuclease/phosphatase family protein [Stackebrandtia sp.]
MTRFHACAAVLAVAVATLAGAAGASGAGSRPTPSLRVYTVNMENLLTEKAQCPGDWHNLAKYIADRPKPDIVFLQEIGGKTQLREFVARLNRATRGNDFVGMAAPGTANTHERTCTAQKSHQLNAIVWKRDELAYLPGSLKSWQSLHEKHHHCVRTKHSGTRDLKAIFSVKGQGTVTAASLHWSTPYAGGRPCAAANARDVDRQLSAGDYGGTGLQIAAGDLNISAWTRAHQHRAWYQFLTRAHFADAGERAAAWTHVAKHGAGHKRRIDFVWARHGAGDPARFVGAVTVGFKEVAKLDRRPWTERHCFTYPKDHQLGCDYSEHRAVSTEVR